MTSHLFSLAVVPGDGIGPEVTAQALAVLDTVAARPRRRLRAHRVRPRRASAGTRRGRRCPTPCWRRSAATTRSCSAPSATRACRRACSSAGCCSGCGSSSTTTSTCGRPSCTPASPRRLPAHRSGDIDFVVVREGTEGPYVGNGGAIRVGTPQEMATEVSVNTAFGVERVVRDAFARAQARPRRKLTLVHKNNVLVHAGHLWSRTVDAVAAEFPDVAVDYLHVDAATIFLVTDPSRFDVIVTDNLFGDILTDLAAADHRWHRPGRQRQHQPRPHGAEHVRAGARLGARHRRAGQGRPDRRDPLGRAAARPPGPARGGRRRSPRPSRPTSPSGRRPAPLHAPPGRSGRPSQHAWPEAYRSVNDHYPPTPEGTTVTAMTASPEFTHRFEPNPHPRSADAARRDPRRTQASATTSPTTCSWPSGRPTRAGPTPRVVPYGPLTLDPATAVLHYAQEVFEGLKAYAHDDGSIWLFRPEANARADAAVGAPARPAGAPDGLVPRLDQGAHRRRPGMGPARRARRASTSVRSCSRPSGSSACGPAHHVTYSRHRLAGRRVLPRRRQAGRRSGCPPSTPAPAPAARVRPSAAATTRRACCPQQEAAEHGCAQVAFLDSAEHTLGRGAGRHEPLLRPVRRLDRHPVAVRLDPRRASPVTRSCTLAGDLGHEVVERRVSIDEWRDGCADGTITEVFACGTAAVVTPVGALKWDGGEAVAADGEAGKVTLEIRSALVDIQYGRAEDRHGWMHATWLADARHPATPSLPVLARAPARLLGQWSRETES